MRVAILGAGGPAGVNALRALHAASHDCVAIDDNSAHLVWCEPYSVEQTIHRTLALTADIDAVIPQPDSLVLWAVQSGIRRCLLPNEGTVWACQDKASTAASWYRQGLREHAPVELVAPWPDHLQLARDAFGLPFWLRATRGAGAKGAIKVSRLDQAYHWLRFWEARDAQIEWVAEEFLPGRDLAWSSIWFKGVLITSFLRERLEYLYPHLTPEGLTGTPTIARIVHEDRPNEVAQAAVRAIDPHANGIYSVDLREDAAGIPRPTEINAGRGFTTFGLWSLYATNFLDIVAHLAAGQIDEMVHYPMPRFNALPDGLTLSRHIDCGHVFTQDRVTQELAA